MIIDNIKLIKLTRYHAVLHSSSYHLLYGHIYVPNAHNNKIETHPKKKNIYRLSSKSTHFSLKHDMYLFLLISKTKIHVHLYVFFPKNLLKPCKLHTLIQLHQHNVTLTAAQMSFNHLNIPFVLVLTFKFIIPGSIQ